MTFFKFSLLLTASSCSLHTCQTEEKRINSCHVNARTAITPNIIDFNMIPQVLSPSDTNLPLACHKTVKKNRYFNLLLLYENIDFGKANFSLTQTNEIASPVKHAVQVVDHRDQPSHPQFIANVYNFHVSCASSISLPKKKQPMNKSYIIIFFKGNK